MNSVINEPFFHSSSDNLIDVSIKIIIVVIIIIIAHIFPTTKDLPGLTTH
jgi:hypothetical protein